MGQIIDIIGSMPTQMKVGLYFFFFVVVGVVLLTQKLVRDAQKDRIFSSLKAKHLGAAEHAATAIISAEREVQAGAGRKAKLAFDIVNWKSISRDMKKAGFMAFPPLLLVGAACISYLIANIFLNVPHFSLSGQSVFVFPFIYYLLRYPLLNTLFEAKQLKALKQLINFIESVKRAVSVGASPDEAVVEAINDTEAPLRDSLETVSELLNLGYDFNDALSLAAEKVDLAEFDIFAASLAAQSSTGGTIGQVLTDVVDTARSRMELKKKVGTMTAESRFNALLLGSLPICLSLYLRTTQPEYFAQLWTNPVLGTTIYLSSLFMAVVGAYLALRIAKIKL